MNRFSTRRSVGLLPVGLRLRLARVILWRLKHGPSIAPTLMLLCLVAGSGALGYAVAMQKQWPLPSAHAADVYPEMAAAIATPLPSERQSQWLLAQELGRLQAEIVTLRVLFLRLADVAQLEGGEFDLDMDFTPLRQSLEDPADTHTLDEVDSFDSSHLQDGGLERLSSPLKQGSMQMIGQVDGQLTEQLTEQLTGQVNAQVSIERTLPLVKRALVHISEQSARLESVYRKRRMAHDFRVSGLPVSNAHISSRYGYRVNPLSGRRQLHRGLDLVGKPGSRILALADGIVTYSGRNGGYGNLVEIEHPSGYRTRYAHNHSLLVPLGARVSKGQVIATMGSTGRSTGTHLHVEVRHEGKALDPQLYIR